MLMDQISTTDKILLKAYNDLSISDELKMNELLSFDGIYQEDYQHIKSMQSLLDKAFENPDPTSVKIILEASMSAELETH